MKVIAETEGLLRQALSEPGLYPQWTASPRTHGALDADSFAKIERLLADPTALAARPARTWDPVLAQAWISGVVYLRDEASRISERAELLAKSLIVRGSSIGAFAVVSGDRVLIRDSTVGAHDVLEGPLALVGTRLAAYVIAGPFVVLLETGIQHFGKAQRFVRVEKSMIGSNASLEGGTHPEQIPLGPLHRVIGVNVARECWIGQNCSFTAGAELGFGVVVAPNTTVTRRISELVFVAGSPARTHPIDFNIRALSAEQAHEEGTLQGHYAVGMPMFGAPRGAWTADRAGVEIEYPRHAVLRSLASENALHFQRGVLDALFAQMFPDYRVTIRHRIGATVRFEVTFDRPFVEHAAPAPDLVMRKTARAGDSGVSPTDRALLDRIAEGGTSLQALGMTEPIRKQLHALALAGLVEPALFRRGANAGFVDPNPEPAVLASRWRLLVDPQAPPLPAFVESKPSAAPIVVAASESTHDSPIDAIAGLVRRLRSLEGPIDLDAPLYQLGIDSITRAELGALVEAQFGITVDIFAERSVRSLADTIARAISARTA